MSYNLFIDTNIIIYHLKGEINLENYIKEAYERVYYSFVSKIELLSFPNITDDDEKKANNLIETFLLVTIDEKIIDETISMKKKYQLKMADSIIVASTKTYSAHLLTNDIELKKKINEVNIILPKI